MADSLQLYMVGVMVEDMTEALTFYRQLGLAVPDGRASNHVQVKMENGVTLFLDGRPEDWDPGYGDEPYGNIIEFYLETEQAVRDRVEEMESQGYAAFRPPYITQFGMCFAMFKDPPGNTILLSGEAASG